MGPRVPLRGPEDDSKGCWIGWRPGTSPDVLRKSVLSPRDVRGERLTALRGAERGWLLLRLYS